MNISSMNSVKNVYSGSYVQRGVNMKGRKFAIPLALLLALLVSIPSASACPAEIDFNPGSCQNTLNLGGNGVDIIAISGSSIQDYPPYLPLDGYEEINITRLRLINVSDRSYEYNLTYSVHSTKFRDVAINPCYPVYCYPNEKIKKDGNLDIILQLKDLDLEDTNLGNKLPPGKYIIYINFKVNYGEADWYYHSGADCVKLVPPDK